MRTILIFAVLASPAAAEWGERGVLGLALLKEGRTAEAIGELSAARLEAEIAREKGDGLAAILDHLGQAEFRAGRYRVAKKYFDRAVRLPVRDATLRAVTLSNAGQACMALVENYQAEEYFRQAMTLMPDSSGLWHRLGQAMLLEGRHSEAEMAFRQALRNGDGDANVLNDLAGLLESQNHRDAAITLLRQAVARTTAGQSWARIIRNLAVLEWKACESGGLWICYARRCRKPKLPSVPSTLIWRSYWMIMPPPLNKLAISSGPGEQPVEPKQSDRHSPATMARQLWAGES